MTRKLTGSKRCALLATAMGLIFGAYSVNSGKELPHTKETKTHFDIKKLGERIMSAHRALISSHDVVHQKTDLQHISQGGDKIHALWVVEWDDCRDEYLCRSSWNAENGKLLFAEHPVQRTGSPLAQDRDRRSAIQASWRWMERMGASRDAPRWHLNSPPLLKALSWIVVWAADGCRATVILDRHTLDLNYLVVKEA